MIYYSFADYWWFYISFSVFLLAVLAVDLGVFHKKPHEVSIKEASMWTALWISIALIFGFLFYLYSKQKFLSHPALLSSLNVQPEELATTLSLEFLTGFLIEKALAVDNIFVFTIVFSYFKIPKIYQHRVLFWGIIGALFLRAFFIALGSYLLEYQWVVRFFGFILFLTGLKMLLLNSENKNLSDNFIIKLMKRFLKIDQHLSGGKFWVKRSGVIYFTPLFVALIFLEISDIIFAVESVPAIFAVTKEPLIVFTSNIFAILGLRSMYFILAGVLDKFKYIKYALSLVLIFIGAKMIFLNDLFGGKFPLSWSLGIILGLILSSVFVSIIEQKFRCILES